MTDVPCEGNTQEMSCCIRFCHLGLKLPNYVIIKHLKLYFLASPSISSFGQEP